MTGRAAPATEIAPPAGPQTWFQIMLNALSEAFADHERIIVIEDTSELQIRKEHVVYLEVTKPDRFGRGGASIRDLFRSSLRMPL